MINNKLNLRRDPLDYLLTDTTPVEISELFTYSYFYDFLHDNKKSLDSILTRISTVEKNTFNQSIPFEGGWQSSPLTYGIVKNDGHSLRKMSIPQPISALNMYYFINLYQKDILNYLDDPVFSVRYQKRNTDLFYRKTNRTSLIDYQYKRDRRSKKVVEQTGRFFDIAPFGKIVDLERSERWRQANLKYKLFCKVDYKRCFDSIYSHAYKWIVTRNVVDSKAFKNSSLFAVIDRMLQNINGASSNGVIVGPEFSRMIVEILLQTIDEAISHELTRKSLIQGEDFEIMRYVDDMFIFSKNDDIQSTILKVIDEKTALYLLEINKLKTKSELTPYFRAEWIGDVEAYKDKVLQVFRTNKELKNLDEKYQISARAETIQSLKMDFEYLIAKYKDDSISITNYMMSVILNSMSSKNRAYDFFKTTTHKSIPAVIDFIFYVFSHAVTFQNNQKLISTLYYINNEVDLKRTKFLQGILKKYEPKIVATNYSDYINQWIAFSELGVYFSSETEELVFKQALAADDPIALATIIAYGKYDDELSDFFIKTLNKTLEEKLDAIRDFKEIPMYREFWYVLIFNKCPYIDDRIQDRYNGLIKKMIKAGSLNSVDRSTNLLAEFLLSPDRKYSFIAWNAKGARMLQEITYRTNNKTVFRKGVSGIEVSF